MPPISATARPAQTSVMAIASSAIIAIAPATPTDSARPAQRAMKRPDDLECGARDGQPDAHPQPDPDRGVEHRTPERARPRAGRRAHGRHDRRRRLRRGRHRVPDDAYERPLGVVQRRVVHKYADQPAIASADVELAFPGSAGRERLHDLGRLGATAHRHDQVHDRPAGDVRRGEAVELLGRPVPAGHEALAVGLDTRCVAERPARRATRPHGAHRRLRRRAASLAILVRSV